MQVKSLVRIFIALTLSVNIASVMAFSDTVLFSDLPKQAQRTYMLIQQGGPFPYNKDGTTFGNYERKLPQEKRGYYREYTVPTGNRVNRGVVRIVCGSEKQKVSDPCYYTDDHYASFQKIVP